MNIFEKFKNIIIEIVKKKYNYIAINLDTIVVERPKVSKYGDISTNAAMVLAKPLGMSPIVIAEQLNNEIAQLPSITSSEVVKPGFINIFLSYKIWQDVIKSIVTLGNDYGSSNLGNQEKINIEFVSVNPTGPMHVGHARVAIFGDVLARIMTKCGFNVTKEFYINDAGGQIDVLVKSVFARYKEALGQELELPDSGYIGKYLIPIGKNLVATYSNKLMNMGTIERDNTIKEFTIEKMINLIKDDLAQINVYHDVFFSEKKQLHDQNKLMDAINLLSEKNFIYEGVLEAPKGAKSKNWQPRKQLLFKATNFGDDVDRALIKENGEYTYFAADIAYHKNKIERGFNKMILCLGADHAGYTKRMQAIVKSLSDGQASIDIAIIRLVNLLKNGTPYKMSKRTGSFVAIKDLLTEVDKDILRFSMLSCSHDTTIDLDIDKIKQQSKDNPVFYVQYAHVRSCSVIEKAKDINYSDGDISNLALSKEKEILKLLAYYPQVIKNIAKFLEPHRLVYYLQNLATEFHALWTLGIENPDSKFIVDDANITKARLLLVQATAKVIASGLNNLGIKALKSI